MGAAVGARATARAEAHVNTVPEHSPEQRAGGFADARGRHTLVPAAWAADALLAQLVEQLTLNQRVRGSNPRSPTSLAKQFI